MLEKIKFTTKWIRNRTQILFWLESLVFVILDSQLVTGDIFTKSYSCTCEYKSNLQRRSQGGVPAPPDKILAPLRKYIL
jgi:hypothetical protein